VRRPLAAAAAGLAFLACAPLADLVPSAPWRQVAVAPPVPPLRESQNLDPAAPRRVRATSGELRAVPLQWDPVLTGDVGGYVIERASAPEGPFLPIAAVAGRGVTSYVDAGPRNWPGASVTELRHELGDAESVAYRVRAYTRNGWMSSAASEPVAAATAPPPDPPQEVRAYSLQPREVPLSWHASRDPRVTDYVIERGLTAEGPFEVLARVQGRHQTVYVDRGLGDLRVFYYRVSAVNSAGGSGEPSPPVRAVTKPQPLPPVGLHLDAQRLGGNELAWEPNVETDLAGYRLLRLRDGNGPAQVVAELGGDGTSALDPDAGADEHIRYRVVAFDRDGLDSAASEPTEVESVGYGLAATARAEGVELRWEPRHDEGWSGARVYRLGLWGEKELAFVRDSHFLDTDVRPGRRYRYRVVLERANGARAPASTPIEVEAAPR
jgi:fibronectin type 3 domain-containing protein